jgi:hypothetical protein
LHRTGVWSSPEDATGISRTRAILGKHWDFARIRVTMNTLVVAGEKLLENSMYSIQS